MSDKQVLTVRITKARLDSYWYAKLIGTTWETYVLTDGDEGYGIKADYDRAEDNPDRVVRNIRLGDCAIVEPEPEPLAELEQLRARNEKLETLLKAVCGGAPLGAAIDYNRSASINASGDYWHEYYGRIAAALGALVEEVRDGKPK